MITNLSFSVVMIHIPPFMSIINFILYIGLIFFLNKTPLEHIWLRDWVNEKYGLFRVIN